MNSIQNKIQKSSKAMAVILKIMYISIIVGLCIPIGTLIWVSADPNINFNLIRGVHFYSAVGMAINSRGEVIAEMCIIILMGVWMCYIFMVAYKMFKSISKDMAPFSMANVKNLKKIGSLLLIYAFVTPIAKVGFYRTFASATDIQFSFDFSFIVLSLSFFFIATVFDYGAELQKETDELL
ncbi:MAG TPA: DUF2975 domain-containing protein [Clostridiales bacterium]|nr:DUF2975 domain-containing protein [Clostridiales bacterium]